MKKLTKLIALFLVFALITGIIPSEVQAASKKKIAKLNKTKVTLIVGKTTTLKVKNSGGKKVKWSTTNKKVATVNNGGKVKAKKKGSCKIKAKIGKKTLTCKVTVKAKANNKATEATTQATTEKKNDDTLQIEVEDQTPSYPNNDNTNTTWDCSISGHILDKTVRKVEPTCTEYGIDYLVCSICGHEEFYCFVTPTWHANSNGTVTKAPTCGENGIETRVCNDCGYKFQVIISNIGIEHDEEYEDVEATCTEPGYTLVKCTSCNKELDRINYTNILGHVYTVKSRIEPTCSEDGLQTKECSRCGNITEEKIGKNAMYHSYFETIIPATCTNTRQVWKECKICGYKDLVGETPSLNHSFRNGVCITCGITREEYDNSVKSGNYVSNK